MTGLSIWGITGMGLVVAGDDVAGEIAAALRRMGLALRPGDVVVVAQKILSKAEGRMVRLADVEVSGAALELAARSEKDPRVCELILRESQSLVRVRPGLVIARHRRGWVCANAGIDRSNVAGDAEAVLLLPEDPDASARRVREGLQRRTGVAPAVIVADSHGRPFRRGAVGVCIGVAGLAPLVSEVGRQDLFGYTLRSTEEALADELASAATVVMGQADEAIPAALVRGVAEARRGVRLEELGGGAGELVRGLEQDLFR